ncbi:MAG: hypothetical protein PHU12_01540 [Candidatus Aenigmarchaeota archaeon]|nr:hypothetical protein [Candidatus Aenigmarchaeota archaeon]
MENESINDKKDTERVPKAIKALFLPGEYAERFAYISPENPNVKLLGSDSSLDAKEFIAKSMKKMAEENILSAYAEGGIDTARRVYNGYIKIGINLRSIEEIVELDPSAC